LRRRVSAPATRLVYERGEDAAGNLQLTYHWYKDDVLLGEAADKTLAFSSCSLTNSGIYRVVVTNQYGSVTSVLSAKWKCS